MICFCETGATMPHRFTPKQRSPGSPCGFHIKYIYLKSNPDRPSMTVIAFYLSTVSKFTFTRGFHESSKLVACVHLIPNLRNNVFLLFHSKKPVGVISPLPRGKPFFAYLDLQVLVKTELSVKELACRIDLNFTITWASNPNLFSSFLVCFI